MYEVGVLRWTSPVSCNFLLHFFQVISFDFEPKTESFSVLLVVFIFKVEKKSDFVGVL